LWGQLLIGLIDSFGKSLLPELSIFTIFAALIGSFLLFYPIGGLPIPSQIIGAVLLGLALISQTFRFIRARFFSSTANVKV
jgi:hypothetical protein